MSKIEGFIERFEDDEVIVVKSDRSVDWVSKSELPPNAREGDFIVPNEDGKGYHVDYIITAMRELEIRRMSENYID